MKIFFVAFLMLLSVGAKGQVRSSEGVVKDGQGSVAELPQESANVAPMVFKVHERGDYNQINKRSGRGRIDFRHDFRLGVGYGDVSFIGLLKHSVNNALLKRIDVGFSYSYRVVKGLKVGLNLAGGIMEGNVKSSVFKIAPMVQYEWVRSRIVTLYSELGVQFDVNKNGFGGADLNVTPIGITIGRELFFFAEAGAFGVKGFVNGGVGYRF